MASLIRTKHKPKEGIAEATKPDNPATVNHAAANVTAVATGGAAKCSCLEHSTPVKTTIKKQQNKIHPPLLLCTLPPLIMQYSVQVGHGNDR
jgi:hypothetical protein